MTSMKGFIKRHPVATYFALVFAVSWGGILLIVGGPSGIPGTLEQSETLLTFVVLTLVAGPPVAGILLTGLIHGRASGTPSGALSLVLFLPAFVFSMAALPAVRVLMVWIYDRTGGSLLVAMLMHASFTASTLILRPPATGAPALTWNLVFAVAMWVVVAAVAVANGGQLSRQPFRKQVA